MSWEPCQLKDVIELAYGKSLPERNRKDGFVPVYGSGGIGGYHNTHLVEGPGVIVGWKGTVGSVFLRKMISSQ
jgi:type I restriction enzyme S subunit